MTEVRLGVTTGMGYRALYRKLLEEIAQEADQIALKYFRAIELRVERKKDGTAVTQADRAVEEMARAKVTASGLELDVLGEEMGGGPEAAPSPGARPRLIIDPIDGTEEFSRGIPTFGTLLGIERDGEIVAALASAPALRSRWQAYKGEGAYREQRRLQVSNVEKLQDSMVFSTGTGPSKDSADQTRIRDELDTAGAGPVYIAILPRAAEGETGGNPDGVLQAIHTCWWRKEPLRQRSIGHQSPGIWRH